MLNSLKGTFKDKSKKEVKKYEKLRFFKFFCLLLEGSGSVQIMTDPDLGGSKTYRYGSHGSRSTTMVRGTTAPGARDLQSRPPELCSAPQTCPPQDTRDWRRPAPQYCPPNLNNETVNNNNSNKKARTCQLINW